MPLRAGKLWPEPPEKENPTIEDIALADATRSHNLAEVGAISHGEAYERIQRVQKMVREAAGTNPADEVTDEQG